MILYDVETYAIDTSGFEDVGEMTKDEFKLHDLVEDVEEKQRKLEHAKAKEAAILANLK